MAKAMETLSLKSPLREGKKQKERRGRRKRKENAGIASKNPEDVVCPTSRRLFCLVREIVT